MLIVRVEVQSIEVRNAGGNGTDYVVEASFKTGSASVAAAKHDELQALIHPQVGLGLLSRRIGFDLTKHPVDEQLPELPPNATIGTRSDMMIDLARREKLKIYGGVRFGGALPIDEAWAAGIDHGRIGADIDAPRPEPGRDLRRSFHVTQRR